MIAVLIISLRLFEVFDIAEKKNPYISSARSEYESSLYTITPQKFPPDPRIMVGKEMFDFGFFVEQMIPFPKKLSVLSKISALQSEIKNEMIRHTKSYVFSELIKAYAEYYYTYRKIKTFEEIKSIYEELLKVLSSQYATGKASLSDISFTIAKIGEIQAEISKEKANLYSPQLKVEALLGGEKVEITPDLPEPKKIPEIKDEDVLNAPLVKIAEIERRVKTQEKEFAKAQYFPDFSLRVGGFFSQGTLGFGFMVGASLPLYSKWKQSPRVISKQKEEISQEEKLQGVVLDTRSFVESLTYLAVSHLENVKTYSEAASSAFVGVQSAMSQWIVGKITLNDVIYQIENYLEFKLKVDESKKDFFSSVADIIRVLGFDPVKTLKEVSSQ